MTKKQKKYTYIILILILAFSLIISLITEGFHKFGYYIVLGFVGAVILIVLAKKILAPLLQRPETYYGDSSEGGEDHA